GIPQVYYVGMLAGKNDLSFDAADHRFINRRNYSLSELAQECERPVVQRLLRLMRLRNSHPAFAGELQIAATADDQLCLKRMVGKAFVTLCANLSNQHFQILYTEDGETKVF
ncbi:MAG: sucrose phosphorylase, partial [Clostridia bacterium]